MWFLKFIGHFIIILVLTALTQVGGLIWLISILIAIKLKKRKRFIFPILYLTFNLFIIPLIAPIFGRTQLPVFNASIKPQNYVYTLAFRNYVTPKLKDYLIKSSIELAHLGIQIKYLDANFPFFDGFPLLPHLSHNDGKKIDIAFQYKIQIGKTTNKKPSLFGYGSYIKNETPTNNYCKWKVFCQYEITKYLYISFINNLVLEKNNKKFLIESLLKHTKNQKLFIEPYLKQELGLQKYSQIRFHGCQAVRHDDHIHLQIK